MQTVLRRIRNVRSTRSTTLMLLALLFGASSIRAQSGAKCFSIVNQACQSCNIQYPDNSNLPRSAVVFNESDVLVAWEPGSMSCNTSPTQIKLWYSDERALLLGVRQVVVKNANGTTSTTNYDVTPTPASPTGVANPKVGTTIQIGDQTGNDESAGGGRPIWPVLYVTDITTNPTDRSGDWQQGGTGIAPTKIYGTWKAAVRTVDNTKSPAVVTIDPDDDPKANGTDLGGGDPVPAGIKTEKFTAEVIWDVNTLNLKAGHTYRIQFMVHDGDQNKTGGDVGEACTTVIMPPLPNVPAPAPAAKVTWTYNAAADTYTFRVTESKDFNNNTYGANAIGWPGGHTFNNLIDSDRVEIVLADANYKTVMDFKLDYLTKDNKFISGYGTEGVNGGNGKMIKGKATDIVSVRTSLSENFNNYGYTLTTSSPSTDNNFKQNPNYKNWIYDVWYEVTVKGSAFGTAGFGSVDIPFLYANPSKTGKNTNDATAVDCPPAQKATLGGKVFNDINNNGLFDGKDTVLPGVTVKLYKDANGDNIPDGSAILVTTTANDGTYSFHDLDDGRYIVGVVTTGGFERGGIVQSGYNPDNNIENDNNGVFTSSTSPEVRTAFKTVGAGKEPSDGGYGNYTLDIGLYKSAIILPVSLVQFNGSTIGNNSVLTWSMANESNVLMYIVESSVDGRNFAATGTLNASNSRSTQNYSFTDANISSPVVYYRLRIISLTGAVSYSNVIQLKFGSVKNSLQVYPNPANGYAVLNITVANRGYAIVKLYNAVGQAMITKQVLLNTGANALTFEGLSKLVMGTYHVSVVLQSGEHIDQSLLLYH